MLFSDRSICKGVVGSPLQSSVRKDILHLIVEVQPVLMPVSGPEHGTAFIVEGEGNASET